MSELYERVRIIPTGTAGFYLGNDRTPRLAPGSGTDVTGGMRLDLGLALSGSDNFPLINGALGGQFRPNNTARLVAGTDVGVKLALVFFSQLFVGGYFRVLNDFRGDADLQVGGVVAFGVGVGGFGMVALRVGTNLAISSGIPQRPNAFHLELVFGGGVNLPLPDKQDS